MSEYRTLQQNQSLNLEYEKNKKEREMQEEIERLNNIITELEKFLEEGRNLPTGCGITIEYKYAYENALDKLKELKENINGKD